MVSGMAERLTVVVHETSVFCDSVAVSWTTASSEIVPPRMTALLIGDKLTFAGRPVALQFTLDAKEV